MEIRGMMKMVVLSFFSITGCSVFLISVYFFINYKSVKFGRYTKDTNREKGEG